MQFELAKLDMLDALLEKRNNMFVFNLVVDFFAVAAGCDNVHQAQAAQVMRNSRFTDADCRRQEINIEFLVGEDGKDAHPAGIAECAK